MNYYARRTAKVYAQNRVNSFVNTAAPLLMEAFRPFIGKDIINMNGTFVIRVRKAIAATVEKLNNENPLIRWRLEIQRYSVVLKADANAEGDGITYYQEQFQYLLDLNLDGNLKALYDGADRLKQFRTNYTVEEIEKKRREIAELEGKLSSLKGEISSFDRFDN